MEEPNNSTVSAETEAQSDINGQTTDEREEVPMEIVKDDEASPARLVINNFDDENEETVLMTIEEAQNYVLSKVETYIRDQNTNPLLVLKNQISSLHDKIKNKSDEFVRLNKMFDALYRDQVKFLRHIGVMPKIDSKTVGVSVDLPWLPDSMPGIINEDMLKSSGDKTFLQPPNGATPRLTKQESSGPIECIDLTDDGDVPNPPVSTSAATASAVPQPTVPISTSNAVSNSSASSSFPAQNSPSTPKEKNQTSQHPAPLPTVPQGNESEIPPKPRLKISVDKNGVSLYSK